MEMKKSELIKVAKELNAQIGLEPEIDTKRPKVEDLKAAILQAAELIEPDDDITPESTAVIAALREEKEEEDSVESVSEPELVPAPEPEPEPKAPPRPKKAMTRSRALVAALEQQEGEAFTATDIIKKSRQIYEKYNKMNDADDRGALAQWEASRYILVDIGLLEPAGTVGRQVSYRYTR